MRDHPAQEVNFHTDQGGMHSQLAMLRAIVSTSYPEFFKFLTKKECDNLYFCFRWILIRFKRELPFDQLLRLWEAIWSKYRHGAACRSRSCSHMPRYHLFVAAAVLGDHADHIMEEDMGFDDMLMYINNLSGKINLDKAMRDAEELYRAVNDRLTAEAK
mmetsp:Transcript_57875/g.136387  ORF Transcript_57875/g.136387 Transcript_57875/m.136387 type:complete len:159 (-) Transcript_57875:60-536(-)